MSFNNIVMPIIKSINYKGTKPNLKIKPFKNVKNASTRTRAKRRQKPRPFQSVTMTVGLVTKRPLLVFSLGITDFVNCYLARN